MSRSVVGRIAQSASLFIAGLLAASALSSNAVAAPASVASTLTRTTSCAAMNFYAVDTDTDFGFRKGVRVRYFENGSGYFLCDPNLPNKATVTKVRFTVVDGSDVAEMRYCALVRKSLSPGAFADDPQVLAEVRTTGMSAKPGAVRLTDSTISRATIDESTYGYWLQCQINFLDSNSTDGAGIIGADVTYKISSANG